MRVWTALGDCVRSTGGAVLVTVVTVDGSAPREAGARMAVGADGGFFGTIGGGTLEWRAIAEAQRLLAGPAADASFRLMSFALGPELGQCCGGRVKLMLEAFSTADLPVVDGFAEAEALGRFSTERRIGGPRQRLPGPAAEPVSLQGDRLVETFGDDERTLFLYGAGHVGRALVLALAPMPFRVVWIDPRPDAFPAAAPSNVTMVAPVDPVATLASVKSGTFVLIMTHSHALDLALAEAALRAPDVAYVGVIGSATKRARFVRRLGEAGIAADKVGELVCPVGSVGLKSKLPAVIAAGVVVELLLRDEAVRAGIAADERTLPGAVTVRRAGE